MKTNRTRRNHQSIAPESSYNNFNFQGWPVFYIASSEPPKKKKLLEQKQH